MSRNLQLWYICSCFLSCFADCMHVMRFFFSFLTCMHSARLAHKRLCSATQVVDLFSYGCRDDTLDEVQRELRELFASDRRNCVIWKTCPLWQLGELTRLCVHHTSRASILRAHMARRFMCRSCLYLAVLCFFLRGLSYNVSCTTWWVVPTVPGHLEALGRATESFHFDFLKALQGDIT